MKNKIRIIAAAIALIAFANSLMGQADTAYSVHDILKASQLKIEMLFPGGKSKALILSFDDGRDADRRLVKMLNDNGLRGTFHLNSNKLGTKDYLTKEEIKDLFKGHEVSVHTADHPNLTTLSKIDVMEEVVEDRRELERLTGNTVRGMAYPFGNYNDAVIDDIKALGIEYARTVDDSYNFSIPADFLRWNPSIHQFGKAYSIPNNPENDRKEIDAFYKLVNNFLNADTLALLDVWGHSWENNGPPDKWNLMENFLKLVSGNGAICYTTQIALVDYINAYKNLKFSVNKNIVTNLSALDIYIKINGNVYKIDGGSIFVLPPGNKK